MRETLLGTRELAKKLTALEKKLTSRLDAHEVAIVEVLQEADADPQSVAPAALTAETAYRFQPLTSPDSFVIPSSFVIRRLMSLPRLPRSLLSAPCSLLSAPIS